LDAGQFHFRRGQIDVRSDNRQVRIDVLSHLSQCGRSGENVVDRQSFAGNFDTEMQRGVGLRIEIDHLNTFTGCGQPGGEIDGRGRFAHAALLIDDRDPSFLIFDLRFLIADRNERLVDDRNNQKSKI
jgi:hypothetical protein